MRAHFRRRRCCCCCWTFSSRYYDNSTRRLLTTTYSSVRRRRRRQSECRRVSDGRRLSSQWRCTTSDQWSVTDQWWSVCEWNWTEQCCERIMQCALWWSRSDAASAAAVERNECLSVVNQEKWSRCRSLVLNTIELLASKQLSKCSAVLRSIYFKLHVGLQLFQLIIDYGSHHNLYKKSVVLRNYEAQLHTSKRTNGQTDVRTSPSLKAPPPWQDIQH